MSLVAGGDKHSAIEIMALGIANLIGIKFYCFQYLYIKISSSKKNSSLKNAVGSRQE